MKTVEGTYHTENGKDYYYIALQVETGEYIQIKNASCLAVASRMASKYFGLGLYSYDKCKLFFMSTESRIDLNRIPKKYHKYFV